MLYMTLSRQVSINLHVFRHVNKNVFIHEILTIHEGIVGHELCTLTFLQFPHTIHDCY